ncbi:lipopolysaccharide biosynthesis protein, partial [Enterococcus cecorum]|uniref:lipopolysaccharide biosynthesis protein n=1 Tax=Enterococcus cecorum TaxID=44008 RepID=UPI003C2E0ECB
LIPHYLSGVILNQSDRLMIQYFSGTSDVAIYSLAYSVGMIINIFTASINSSFVPWTYQTYKNRDFRKIKKISLQLTILVAIITFIPVVLAPEVISLMGSASYKNAAWIVPPIAIAAYFNFVYSLFSNIEFYYANGKYAMLASGSYTHQTLPTIHLELMSAGSAGLKLGTNLLAIPWKAGTISPTAIRSLSTTPTHAALPSPA